MDFLRELKENNTPEWFQAHYADYERLLVEPAAGMHRFQDGALEHFRRLAPLEQWLVEIPRA